MANQVIGGSSIDQSASTCHILVKYQYCVGSIELLNCAKRFAKFFFFTNDRQKYVTNGAIKNVLYWCNYVDLFIVKMYICVKKKRLSQFLECKYSSFWTITSILYVLYICVFICNVLAVSVTLCISLCIKNMLWNV